MRKKLRLMPMIVFLLIVYPMSAIFIFAPKSGYSSLEKRYLEDFPKTNAETVLNGEFEKGFESYFTDHFPVRSTWVGINAYSNLLVGNNGANNVYNSGDDYLINAPVSEENRIETNIEVLKTFSENNKLKMTFMLVPSTGYILEDKLPAVHNYYNNNSDFNTVKKELKGTNIDFVDLRARFKSEAQSGKQLYYRTDHHWTAFGAYTAYTQLMDELGKVPAKKADFKIESYTDFYGTTYSTSGFWLTAPDKIELWKNPKNDKKISLDITDGQKTKSYDSMFFTKHLDEDDKYPVFIDGNHALETITNKNVKSGRLLVIKDSFSHCMAPFLAENYRTVTLVDPRLYKSGVSKLIKDGKYDDVLVLYGIDNFATDTDLAWLS